MYTNINDGTSYATCIHNQSCLSRQKVVIAKGDSGALSHFIKEEDHLKNVTDCNGPTIQLPRHIHINQ